MSRPEFVYVTYIETTPEKLCGQWLVPDYATAEGGWCPGRPVAGFQGFNASTWGYEGGGTTIVSEVPPVHIR